MFRTSYLHGDGTAEETGTAGTVVDAHGGTARLWPGGHPFYERLNPLLDEKKFDEFVDTLCAPFYAASLGRPGLAPGIYFRLLMVGYFEGIDSERGIAWRASDSLSIRSFVRI